MCTEAVAVVRAVVADFFLDRWHVEIGAKENVQPKRDELAVDWRNLRNQDFFLATDPEVRVRFPALPDFLRSSGSGTGSTQPREYN
jgi:hypothetical protein